MSRIAKQPILIPEKTEITKDGRVFTVKGPKGELKREFKSDIAIEISEGSILLSVPAGKESVFTRSLWGTYAAHFRNMIKGVTEGFEKQLIIEGVGFKSALNGKTLEMSLGFSHQVKMEVPEGIDLKVEKNNLTISGMDKELVGSFAASIRAKKKPEPYKGKGIRYSDEIIRRKQGKKTV